MIRVLVAEDEVTVRQALVALLGLEHDIAVTAAVGSGDQILPIALQHHPDVALLDIGLPGTDGITAAAQLGRQLPSCRVDPHRRDHGRQRSRRAARRGIRLPTQGPAGRRTHRRHPRSRPRRARPR